MSIRERIRGYSQISNQIMFAIIVIVIIFVAITSSISYTDTKNNIEKTWQYNILSSEQWMSDSLILMGDGLRLFELTYDDDLKEAFTPFFDAYNKSDGDPLSINLAGIRSSLYPAVRDKIDFYIIDPEGIVINSTYQKDIGMNFQSYNDKDPELFSKLTAIRLGDSFESDRAVLGFNHNKTIRKFLYAPSPDHQYLLELSYSIDKYVKERADFSYLNIVESVDKTNPEIKRVTLYDRGLRPIHKNTTFLPEYSIQNYEDLQKVVKTKKPFERVDSPNNTLIRYFYVDIGGNKTVSGNLVDMVTRIEYDTTILNDRIKSALLYHCIVIFLAALLGLIIAFIISHHLTRPIKKIISDIDIIAHGDLDHQIHKSGSVEFASLEKSITVMITSLKSLIQSLQDKEACLLESEQRYRSLIENQRDLICRFDGEGRLQFINETFSFFFHVDPSKILGRTIYDLMPVLEGNEIRRTLMNLSSTEQSLSQEFQFRAGNGLMRWLLWNTTGIRGTGGEISGYQVVARDISDLKHVEQALIESEEKSRLLISNLPDYIVVHMEGIILFVNEVLAERLGYSRDEIIGSSVYNYIPPVLHNKTRETIRIRLAGVPIEDYEFSLLTKDGSIRLVILRAVIIPYEGKKAILTVLTDITDRKKAEEAVRKGEERYRRLVEYLNEGIIINDSDSIITFTNSRMGEMLGYTTEELTGRSFMSLVASESIAYTEKKIEECKSGISTKYQITLIKADGNNVYAEVSATPHYDDSGEIIGSFAVISDITLRRCAEHKVETYTHDLELKKAELEIIRDQLFTVNRDLDRIVRERTEQVMRLLKQKDEFIMQLGHDLRTPLTPVLGLLPGLIEETADPNNREALQIINQNVSHIFCVADKSLKLARMSSFELKPEIEIIPLNKTIHRIVAMYADALADNGIEVICEITDDLLIGADPILFQEVIENLLSNGMKYIGRDDGKLSIHAMRKDDTIELSISDNGIGLQPYETEKIFEEFYKSDRSRHDKSSTGLGLAICRRIISNHGGSIRAESEGPGTGTRIIITIPAWNDEITKSGK